MLDILGCDVQAKSKNSDRLNRIPLFGRTSALGYLIALVGFLIPAVVDRENHKPEDNFVEPAQEFVQ